MSAQVVRVSTAVTSAFIGLALAVALTGCGAAANGSQAAPPASPTGASASAPVTSPDVDAALTEVQKQLATLDGAVSQSAGDLSAGQSAASQSDD